MSEGIVDIEQRYNQFQSEAVANVLTDFQDKPAGRFLLVIPTGGGKTFTAVKALNKLFAEGVLNPESEKVVWAAHRQELLRQANSTFEKFEQKEPDASFRERIEIMMISRVRDYVKKNENQVRLVVIDEAHRSAEENKQYGPLFAYPNLGILGLTATPSRHDGKPLNFEKESYSIGFPDLVEKQIILNPEIREIEGGRFDGLKRNGAQFDGLDALGSEERDKAIVDHIFDNKDEYQKIIVFVGAVNHTESLCKRMNSSKLREHYDSIDYIHGGGWSGGGDREDFIAKVKSADRSIVINSDILTEGYDDPTVNTVIMARPSRSKLVYMQAVGRAIRVNPNDPSKTAYIVEVVDDLPNIRYRINNRWLFSEISDALEPAVDDRFFGNAVDFRDALQKIYEDYSVRPEHREYPEWKRADRYSILLFRFLAEIVNEEEIYEHLPILINNETRMPVSNWFNFLSDRMEKNREAFINPEAAMRMAAFPNIPILADKTRRQLVYEAMESASESAATDQSADSDTLHPWVTFIALRFRETNLDQEIQAFIADMVNKEAIERQIKEKAYLPGATIVKFPLPLASYIGQILTASEFNHLQSIVDSLQSLRDSERHKDHSISVRNALDRSTLPVNMIYREAIPSLIRENLQYYKLLP